MSKKKYVSLLVCPRCGASDYILDKGLLPGGAALLTYPAQLYVCLKCDYRGNFFLVKKKVQ